MKGRLLVLPLYNMTAVFLRAGTKPHQLSFRSCEACQTPQELHGANKGSLQFEDKWDLMRPIVLKLLRQESVTKQQWFDLFSDVHAVCLWDDKGPAKIHQALKEDILDFIKQAQAVRKPVCLFYGRTNTD
ncbi:hypothetical protein GOODEAATRI_024293 [Goodea atripinnis]|uniref:Uncharacterized protein n=1 Tax=Goodea atripinnis TaxID=208336 RepID=A0ABV0PR78_9TELE